MRSTLNMNIKSNAIITVEYSPLLGMDGYDSVTYRILDKLHASYSEAMEAYEADNA